MTHRAAIAKSETPAERWTERAIDQSALQGRASCRSDLLKQIGDGMVVATRFGCWPALGRPGAAGTQTPPLDQPRIQRKRLRRRNPFWLQRVTRPLRRAPPTLLDDSRDPARQPPTSCRSPGLPQHGVIRSILRLRGIRSDAGKLLDGPAVPLAMKRRKGRPSVGQIDSSFGLECIDLVVLDYRQADFKRERKIVRYLTSDPDVRGKKQAASLARHRIAAIHPDIRARIERNEPAIREAEIEGRSKLQIADILACGIAGEAGVVSHERFKIAARIFSDSAQRIPNVGMIRHLPAPRLLSPVGAISRAPAPTVLRASK